MPDIPNSLDALIVRLLEIKRTVKDSDVPVIIRHLRQFDETKLWVEVESTMDYSQSRKAIWIGYANREPEPNSSDPSQEELTLRLLKYQVPE